MYFLPLLFWNMSVQWQRVCLSLSRSLFMWCGRHQIRRWVRMSISLKCLSVCLHTSSHEHDHVLYMLSVVCSFFIYKFVSFTAFFHFQWYFRLSDDLRKVFSVIILMNVFISACTICFIALQITSAEGRVHAANYVMTFLFLSAQVYQISYFGSKLNEAVS